MPRIQLKPRSAEYADGTEAPQVKACDVPGCPGEGLHKAPKNRSLQDHYWFCLAHVQDYNRAWDFFSGMSQQDVESHIVSSMTWDRPTRRYDGMADMENNLYRKAWQTYHYTDEEPPKPQTPGLDRNSPEFQALAILGLEPPLDLKLIKARYRELAKKHHPDANNGDPKAAELFKTISMAYTILRLAAEKYEKLS